MIKRTLYFENPTYLFAKDKQLCIANPDNEDYVVVPIEDIAIVILDHPRITITHGLIRGLQNNKVVIISCNEKHMPQGMMLPIDGNSAQSEIQRYQLDATEPLLKNLWKQTVEAKVNNQSLLLKSYGYDAKRLDILKTRVLTADSSNIEAQAARYYWSMMFTSFKRDRYGAPPNSLLNYGYTILRSMIARALVSSGLLLTKGIFHKNKYNAYCLADDIMEPYRPFVDMLVYGLHDENNPNELITVSAKRKLLSIATVDAFFGKNRRPLMVGMSQTTKSLADCFRGVRRKIVYPEIIF